jgi:SPP1 gp7 family putative phage head morphogenesis protein
MTPLEQELARQRRARLRIEADQAREIKRTYLMVYKRLKARLKELQWAIDEAKAADQPIKTSWLVHQWQYEQLIRDVEAEVWAWSRQVTEIVSTGQRRALSTLTEDQRRLIELSLGAAPKDAVAQVSARFIGLQPFAVQSFVGIASDGKPLGRLLAEIAPETTRKVKDQLAYSIASGQGPREMATSFRKVASLPLDRALTISRTEMHRAVRAATRESYRQSQVVGGWVWHAQLDDRTCSACYMMSGTEHTNNERLDGHPNCRCSMVPKTLSWKELGFDGMEQYERPSLPKGEDIFNALPADSQRAILGPKRYELFKNGEITLADTVSRPRSRTWGTMRRQATVAESRRHAAAH